MRHLVEESGALAFQHTLSLCEIVHLEEGHVLSRGGQHLHVQLIPLGDDVVRQDWEAGTH